MKLNYMKNLLLVLLIFLSGTHLINAQNSIDVEIVNFKSNDGIALVGLYNSDEAFLKEAFIGKKVAIKNNKVIITFKDIPDGFYAISVVHDKDENDELTTNLIGIPKESYGASNDAPARFGPPKWKDAKFEVKNGKVVKQKINL